MRAIRKAREFISMTDLRRNILKINSYYLLGDKHTTYNLNYFSTSCTTAQVEQHPMTRAKHNRIRSPLSVNVLNKHNVQEVTLNPTKYKEWTKKEACSLLCAPKDEGGAGLSIEIVKTLYDKDFRGSKIYLIVFTIRERDVNYAIKYLEKEFERDVCECLVNWVNDLIKKKFFHLWSEDQIREELCKPIGNGGAGLSAERIKHFELYKMIRDISRERYPITDHPNLDIDTFKKIKTWMNQITSSLCVPIVSFDITVHIQKILQELPTMFHTSMIQWTDAIETAINKQQTKLGTLYRAPLLPDHYNEFKSESVQNWSNHFNGLCIPEDKGKELINLLSYDVAVGRGHEFHLAFISLIDLSTAGKTNTIFQLANSKPSIDRYKSFFVINFEEGSSFFDQFLEHVDLQTHSTEDLVTLLAATVNIFVSTLVEKVPSIKPIDFLKFIRNGGEEILKDTFLKLVKFYKRDDYDSLYQMNEKITIKLVEKGIKVVFSFDKAEKLLTRAVGTVFVHGQRNGSLFNALYEQIRIFNNPIFLGTKYIISEAKLGVSQEGRQLVRPIIGTLEPWFLPEVERALTHMFNIEDVKIQHPEEFYMLCYLLSGSPGYVTMFHKLLLENSNNNSNDKLSILRDSIGQVVELKKQRSESRLSSFFKDNRLMDRTTHLLRLLFNKECIFQEKGEYPKYLIQGVFSDLCYSQVFIENSIAHPVEKSKKSSKFFDIVDPIATKTFFENAFNFNVDYIWKFMTNEFVGNSEEFEQFMVMLLIHESKSLKGQPFTKSPLFRGVNEKALDEWCMNVTSLINDRSLSKKLLEYNKNFASIWLAQSTQKYLKDAFLRPDTSIGYDGIFYLKHCKEEKYQLVRCAMTLVVDDKQHTDKAANLLKTLFQDTIDGRLENANNIYDSFSNSVLNMTTLRWIVVPNMDNYANNVSTNSSKKGSFKLIVTDGNAIEECLSCYKDQTFYPNMVNVWKKFKVISDK